MFAGTRCEDIDVADIRETRGDIGSRRRQTGTLLPSSSHSPSALGEYPRKCNLPSIQPLISKELLEPVSMYIYIYISLCDGCVIRNEERRRGGCRREASQRFADTATPRKIYFGPKRSASPKSAGIYMYIYIFERRRDRKESKRMDSPRPQGEEFIHPYKSSSPDKGVRF